MLKVKTKQLLFFLILLTLPTMKVNSQNSFKLISLGCGGGVDESNLSSYLISDFDEDQYICLDAGTLMHGLILASNAGIFDHLKSNNQKEEIAAYVLHHHIGAYAITHPHLDHVAGMLMAAPIDNAKTIYTSPKTANDLMEHIFESPLWGNFTNEGQNPIGKWGFIRMDEKEWYPLPNSTLQLKRYPLYHSYPNESSAFLVKNNDAYTVYFGDTGMHHSESLQKILDLLNDIKPLLIQRQLKAIIIEVSFPNSQPDDALYGHLKPSFIQSLLQELATFNSELKHDSLKGLKVFISHMKPNYRIQNNNEQVIEQEINALRSFGAEIIILQQTKQYNF
mgnify:CR=1 FL=1